MGTWNLLIDQQLGSNWLLSFGYFGNGGYHLSSNAIGRRQLNPAIYIPGQSTEANTQVRRIDRSFGGVYLYPTDLNSRYKAPRSTSRNASAKASPCSPITPGRKLKTIPAPLST